jgi:hypothetical protein
MDLQEIRRIINTVRGLGVDVGDEVAEYARQRARHLAGILEREEPGFAQALVAERDNVALKAGIVVADASDNLARGAIAGILAVLAHVLGPEE